MFHTAISVLQHAHALSTIRGYRGYGAEQGNMVFGTFILFYFLLILNKFVG